MICPPPTPSRNLFAGEPSERRCLPFDSRVSALRDIADAFDSIQQFTEGMDFEAFRQDLKTIAAVECKLLVISEAAIRLAVRPVAEIAVA